MTYEEYLQCTEPYEPEQKQYPFKDCLKEKPKKYPFLRSVFGWARRVILLIVFSPIILLLLLYTGFVNYLDWCAKE